MSNMPAVDKQKVSLQIPIRLVAKMDHMATAAGLSRNDIATSLLDRGTANVELTVEEVEAINAKIKENINARNNG